MTASEIEALVEDLYRAYNAHDLAGAARVYAETAEHEEVAQRHPRAGRDAIVDGLSRFFDAFPDAAWAPESVFLSADGAAVTYRLQGTLQGSLGPFVPRGQALDLRGVHVFHVAGGVIVRSEDYWDAATFGRQMATGLE